MTSKQRKRLAMYNTIAGKQSFLADAIAAMLGAILIIGPFILYVFNWI